MFSSLMLLGALTSTIPVAMLALVFGSTADRNLSADVRLTIWRLGWLLCVLAPVYVLLLSPFLHHRFERSTLPLVDNVGRTASAMCIDLVASGATLIILLIALLQMWRLALRFAKLSDAKQSSQPAELSTCLQLRLPQGQETARLKHALDIRLTDKLRTVVLVGIGHPAVMIPKDTISSSSSQQLHLIISHEMAHLYRGDHWLVPLERIIDAALWFNPLLRRVLCGLDAAREEVCDAVALKGADRQSRTSYAHALLKTLMSTASLHPQPSWTQHTGDIRMRVNAILEPKASSPRRAALGSALSAATVAASALTGTACAQALAAAPSVSFAKVTVTADEVVTSADRNVFTWRGSPKLIIEGPGRRPLVMRNGHQIATLLEGKPLALSKRAEVISYKDGSPEAIAHGANNSEQVIEIRDR